MKMLRPWIISVNTALAISLLACTHNDKPAADPVPPPVPAAPVAKPLPTTLNEAVNSEFRKPENKARDVYRHPAETLQFFGLQDNMSVVEIIPGAGWYSEILGPYLSAHGKFMPTVSGGTSEYAQKQNKAYQDWLAANPEIKATPVTFDEKGFTVPEPVDMILTFRNVHNWMEGGYAQAIFNAAFKALKPGGILGVEEHRENAKKKQDPKAKSGYVKESEVIRFAEKAGFKLEGKSEINANPKDTKDYKDGVWTLPPVLRNADQDKEKYLAIGESDRMTLKFVKPAPAAKKAAKKK